MNETPFPFTVFAMTIVGFPFVSLASSSAEKISRNECPLISIARQPNDSHFSFSGEISMISLTVPSIWRPL